MNRKKIIALISAVFISVSATMVGCSTSVIEENKNLVISKENVSSKSDLKIEETTEIVFETALVDNQYSLKIDENGDLVVEQIEPNIDKNLALYGLVNVEENTANLEYLISKRYEDLGNSSIQFYVESISENEDKVIIRNYLSEEGYEIERTLIGNGSNKYTLAENILFEQVINDEGVVTNIIWHNLTNETEGSIEVPEEYKAISGINLLGDKAILSALPNTDSATLPTTLLIANLDNGSIEKEREIGDFGFVLPIDEERVILLGALGEGTSVDIYNVNTEEKSQLFEYISYESEEEDSLNISYIGLFPSKDKIYYCEYTNKMAYIKVAKINGMGIERPLTLCELNIEEEYIGEPPTVVIGKDEKEVIVYTQNSLIGGIEKFYKIKLNK